MIRLQDLIQLPDPFPPERSPTISASELRSLKQKSDHLVALCVSTGVMNDDEGEDFSKEVDDLLSRVGDLQHRLTLNEYFDSGNLYDLRVTWKEEYQKFLRFRDIIRTSLNLMVREELVTVENADGIKEDVDSFYLQMVEINKTINRILQRL